MKRNETGEKGVLSFSLSGESFGGPDNLDLMERIAGTVERAGEKVSTVIVDLEKLEWISGTGVGLLVTLRSRLAKQGIKVKLEKPNARVLSVLQVTRLNMIFEVIE
ncbi:MAG: STAS domain-containing protein [Patescibacteria group bacterium]